jgi:homogentisate 1,2-dioxygenase
MLDRICLGQVARKHHTVLRDDKGQLLYEHCLTRRGFDGAYSILYERSLPPRDAALRSASLAPTGDLVPDASGERPSLLSRRHFFGGRVLAGSGGGDHISTRRLLFVNDDVAVGICRPQRALPRYFSNGDGDDLFFVHAGRGTLETIFGPLRYGPGDYLLIPRGTTYRVVPDPASAADGGPGAASDPLWLVIEGRSYMEIPPNFRNPVGQLRMDAPYSHRDFRRPERLPGGSSPDFTPGSYPILIKRGGTYHEVVRDRDPLDIAGWDGAVYPIALSIHDYQPKTGRVHLPPTTFSTFVGGGFIVCSFVPRLVDFDENAIPCPYPHSSPDCDEVLFYVSGNFTSRRGVGPTSLSFHPAGIPHGPQPGAYEASIGKTRTDELAVMLDTFKPLLPTPEALAIEDGNYHATWRA